MAGWLEDHVAAIGSLHSTLWFNGDRVGPLGESGDS
jgi:hypothetical protein